MFTQIFIFSLYTVYIQFSCCFTLPVPLKAMLLSILKWIFIKFSWYGTECFMPTKTPIAIYEAYIIVFIFISCCSNYFASLAPAAPLKPRPLYVVKIKSEKCRQYCAGHHGHFNTFAACHRARQYELLTSPASVFLNSHCNQTFFTRMMQSFILLPKLLRAWHSLCKHLWQLVHIY